MCKTKMINWEIDRIKCTGYAEFKDYFNLSEVEEIQQWYINKKKKVKFKNKVLLDDKLYKNRTLLEINWDKGDNSLGFIMFNPSFANPEKPDDTLRNTIRFAKGQGYNKIIVQNLFPIRISGAEFVCNYYNKKDMSNYKYGIDTKKMPQNIVLCWGKLPKDIKGIDTIIMSLVVDLKNENKNLYQITGEIFQRHLASPSVNSYGGIEKLTLTPIKDIEKIFKFE